MNATQASPAQYTAESVQAMALGEFQDYLDGLDRNTLEFVLMMMRRRFPAELAKLMNEEMESRPTAAQIEQARAGNYASADARSGDPE